MVSRTYQDSYETQARGKPHWQGTRCKWRKHEQNIAKKRCINQVNQIRSNPSISANNQKNSRRSNPSVSASTFHDLQNRPSTAPSLRAAMCLEQISCRSHQEAQHPQPSPGVSQLSVKFLSCQGVRAEKQPPVTGQNCGAREFPRVVCASRARPVVAFWRG